jgi:hypothetical protein
MLRKRRCAILSWYRKAGFGRLAFLWEIPARHNPKGRTWWSALADINMSLKEILLEQFSGAGRQRGTSVLTADIRKH